MTGHYRVTAMSGWSLPNVLGIKSIGPYFAITATEDATSVSIQLSQTAQIMAGGAIQASGQGSVQSFMMSAGDVVELVAVGDDAIDLSGSLVQADKPVQVIAGMPVVDLPHDATAADHIEQTVLPAETWGKHYFVPAVTAPDGSAVGQIVRVYGNVDGTALSYPAGAPMGAPVAISAGQVADLGVVADDFEVMGDHEFAVGLFQQGGSRVDPSHSPSRGDPSQSAAVTVEQYRTKYVFLAPADYDVSYADIVQPIDAKLTLDGAPLTALTSQIGTSGFGITRVALSAGVNNGAHVLLGDKPFGLQVIGYGSYTSYQYPGGLNLQRIAPPPPDIK